MKLQAKHRGDLEKKKIKQPEHLFGPDAGCADASTAPVNDFLSVRIGVAMRREKGRVRLRERPTADDETTRVSGKSVARKTLESGAWREEGKKIKCALGHEIDSIRGAGDNRVVEGQAHTIG